MKVADLISKLDSFPHDYEVYIGNSDTTALDVDIIGVEQDADEVCIIVEERESSFHLNTPTTTDTGS